jgi:hypothetical protein
MAMVMGVHVLAQKPVERTYMIEFSGLDDRSDEKVVLSALIDQDPNALISIALTTHQAKVRTITELDRTALQNTIAPSGISVIRFNQLVSVPMDHPDRQAETSNGQSAAEMDAYREQKLQWMEDHPGVPFPVSDQQVPHDH